MVGKTTTKFALFSQKACANHDKLTNCLHQSYACSAAANSKQRGGLTTHPFTSLDNLSYFALRIGGLLVNYRLRLVKDTHLDVGEQGVALPEEQTCR